MDEQRNGAPDVRRRRRAAAQERAFEDYARAQKEDAASEIQASQEPVVPETEQRIPAEPLPREIKPNVPVWEDEGDDYDWYEESQSRDRKPKKKSGGSNGCLIGILIVLLLIALLVVGWFAFPQQRVQLLSQLLQAGTPDGQTLVMVTPTPEPTATPMPTPTPTPVIVYVTAEPTQAPTPTVEPTATPVPTPTPTPVVIYVTAEPTQVPTAAPTPVPTAVPTPTPTAVPTPTVVPTPTPTVVPTPTPTVVPTPTPTVVPTPTPTVVPTPTPEPTPTPTPSPAPYEASNASAGKDADPSKVIKESFVLAAGEKADGLTRMQSVSMGDPEKYSEQAGVLTFRGGPLRQNGAYGTAQVEQEQLSVVRGVRTFMLGNEYTGFGYGSQPLIVKWYSNIRAMMNIKEESRNTKAMKEVILPSRDGRIYFFDLDTKAYSRDPIDVGLPLDVTASVNPFGFPLLYVGQTKDSVEGYTGVIGMRIYNLINQNLIGFETGLCDQAPSAKNGSVVSSPMIEKESDTLIYGADNGMLYTISMNTDFDLENGKISIDPQTAAYGYRTSLRNAQPGISASVATYGDYAYFGDKAGALQCVDMNTMQCVWAIDMGDSVLASVALECEEDGDVYLYAGNVINKNERSGPVRLVKVDALTGDIVWECPNEIKGRYASAPAKEGLYAGLMASPVVGQGDISDLVIFNVNRVVESNDASYAVVYALDKQTGEEVWSQPMDVDSVSSPIAIYQPDGKSYLVMGDENGTLRLMDGFTGTTISTVNLGSPIQASPAAYGNSIVVGTTGGMIYFVDLL